jgi:hypothetical protein
MEIFKLVGSIFIDNESANQSLAKTDEKANSVGNTLLKGVTSAGKFALGIGAAAGAGATALMGVATKSAEAADEIDKMSQKMGISKQGYQEWSYVMGQNGMNIDTLNAGMKTLVNQMESASNGSATASSYFEQLGISIYDANGNLKDQETMLNETIYALADVEDMTMRSALATDLFGKAGTEMLPMLNSGSEGMKALTERSHELGLIMSDEAVGAGVLLGDTMDDVKQSFGAVVTKIGVEVMPIIQTLLEWILAHMPEIQNIVGEAFVFVQDIITVVIDLIKALMPVIEVVFKYVGTLWNTMLKPILNEIIGFLRNVFSGNFTAAFENIVNIVKNLFNGLVSVVKSPLNSVITVVNNFISGLNKLKIPDWVPVVGGKSINIPKIPLLAKGGNVIQRGNVIVGDAGPELLELPAGARVTPLTNSKGQMFSETKALEEKLDTLIALMSSMVNNQYGVYLDGGVMVGQLAPALDTELGRLAIRKGRGA